MPKAMNLTFGDFIMLEIALVHYIQNLDLSMMSGQYVTELIGKLEYEMTQIKQAGAKQFKQEDRPLTPLTDDPLKP